MTTTAKLLAAIALLLVGGACSLDDPFSDDSPTAPETRAVAGFRIVPAYQGTFNCTRTSPCTVRIIDGSINGRSWRYDFGDGSGQVADDEPIHDFVENGSFTVTQRVCPTVEFDYQSGRCDTEQARISVP